MIAYKFRTTQELHLVIDILLNQRLYCCPSIALNDIREGDAGSGEGHAQTSELRDYVYEVRKRVKELRVLSLTKSFDNHLLWAHYAGGYSGMVIEVEVDDADVDEVVYSNDTIFLGGLVDETSPEDAAKQMLIRKYTDWQYEREVRIITRTEFYKLKRPISRVIVGSRMNPVLIDALRIICDHIGIAIQRMVVGNGEIYPDVI